MAMTWIWTGMVVLSLVFGLFTGNLDAVADAAMDGAASMKKEDDHDEEDGVSE